MGKIQCSVYENNQSKAINLTLTVGRNYWQISEVTIRRDRTPQLFLGEFCEKLEQEIKQIIIDKKL